MRRARKAREAEKSRVFGFKVTYEPDLEAHRANALFASGYSYDTSGTWLSTSGRLQRCNNGFHFFNSREQLVKTSYYWSQHGYGIRLSRALWLVELGGEVQSDGGKAWARRVRFCRQITVEERKNLKKLEYYVQSWLRKEEKKSKNKSKRKSKKRRA